MTNLAQKLDEEALPLVEEILGVEAENTGGGVMCFVFYGSNNGKTTDLYFGYANGPLGFCLMGDDGGTLIEAADMSEDSDATAQAKFVKMTCAHLGFKIEAANGGLK